MVDVDNAVLITVSYVSMLSLQNASNADQTTHLPKIMKMESTMMSVYVWIRSQLIQKLWIVSALLGQYTMEKVAAMFAKFIIVRHAQMINFYLV